jgi:histidinol-phosphatase
MTDEIRMQALVDFALDATWQAGRVTLGHYQRGVTAERKADNSPVTVADREAEQLLRELIQRYWPEHGVLGEEYGRSAADAPYTWIIDPIDGTKSFMAGVPLYANLLALTHHGRPLLGVANFPALGEMVYATRGGGCFWNGRRAHVSAVDRLADARLLTSELNHYGARQPVWDQLVAATYFQRTWGDAYGYFLVATGRAEIMLDPAHGAVGLRAACSSSWKRRAGPSPTGRARRRFTGMRAWRQTADCLRPSCKLSALQNNHDQESSPLRTWLHSNHRHRPCGAGWS